jgi:hypothetical protein
MQTIICQYYGHITAHMIILVILVSRGEIILSLKVQDRLHQSSQVAV